MNLHSRGIVNYLLLPLSLVFYFISRIRFLLYKCHVLRIYKASVPIIVVGNITVGGSGKTPIVIALTRYLQNKGMRVGVISRGYGRISNKHIIVTRDSQALECGDEPLLIHLRTDALVSVSSSKVQAIKAIEQKVDVIISDDGLQHYKMHRDIEVVVFNGVGNGWYLPAGALRESKSRLRSADVVITKEEMNITPINFVNALSGDTFPLDYFADTKVHAVCAISQPERFFDTLSTLGIAYTSHIFADHYHFTPQDFEHLDTQFSIVTTAKDWVKYKEFAGKNIYYLEVEIEINSDIFTNISSLLEQYESF